MKMMELHSTFNKIGDTENVIKLLFVVDSIHQVVCNIVLVYKKGISNILLIHYFGLSINIQINTYDLGFLIGHTS